MNDEWPERPSLFRSFWPPVVSIKCGSCATYWRNPEFAAEKWAFPPCYANEAQEQVTRAHCPRCGVLLPELAEMVESGFAVEHPTKGKPFIGTQSELRRFFADWQGCKIQLWEYVVSHSYLTFRLTHSNSTHAFLRCMMTKSIELPSVGWSANLTLQNADQPEYWLMMDYDASVRVECRMIGVFHGLKTY